MKLRILILLLAMALITTSCASKKAAEKGKPGPEIPTAEGAFRLPETPSPEEAAQEKVPPMLEAVIVEEAQEEKYILLNFENTDIKTIISTFSELLKINYILTPGVSGNVTIQSYRKFPVSDLFPIFQSVLEVNGLTAIKQGEFYRIVPIDTAKQQAVDVGKGREMSYTLDSSFVTQLIPFSQVKATDVANILRNLMPRGTDIIIYEPANMIVVTALPATLAKFMKVVEAIDIPEAETDTIKTFVYHVEHGEAKTLETILKSIYTGKTAGAVTPARPVTTPAPSRATRTAPAAVTVPASLEADLGDLSITAYEEINALIIKAAPRDYLALLEVLKRIDIPPKQVLIEVMIAEIQLTDDLQYGLEWLIRTGSGDSVGFTGAAVTTPPTITTGHPGGFAAVVSGAMSKDAFSYIISALEGRTKINVLATPLILAMDNMDAEIKIGSEVPIATSTTSSTEGITTSSQIQYRSVGTLLTVTPRITEKGNVSMKLTVESSNVNEEGRTINTGTFPEFTTRKTTTTAVVEDNHTLFLGGLISEQKSTSSTGIPWLNRIPILGILFGSHTKGNSKTELIVMVTPHVVTNQEAADAISKQFQDKLKIIRKSFGYKDEDPHVVINNKEAVVEIQ